MRIRIVLLVLAILILCTTPVFAQGGAAGNTDIGLRTIGIGIGMGIASGLCGIGQGRATAGAAEAIARNPGAAGGIRFALILGLVLIESLALYTFVIVFPR